MSYRSDTQPYCRCCGKPIKKRTEVAYFGQWAKEGSYHRQFEPKTRAEAQALVNGKVISVSRHGDGIGWAGVWDGESYVDGTFCTIQCAQAFAYMAAKEYPDLITLRADEQRRLRRAHNPESN